MKCTRPTMKPMVAQSRTQRRIQPADGLGAVFKPVALRIEIGTHLPVGGLLTPAGPLRRCQLLELPRGRDRQGARLGDGWMLRLRVRGDAMRDDGIRDGDYLVLDTRAGRLRDGQTVLADEAGCTVVRRVRGSAGDLRLERLETAGEALPLLRGGRSEQTHTGGSDPINNGSGTHRIHGAVVGILRKELRQPSSQHQSARTGSDGPPLEPVQRLRILQRSLRAVKSTYGATRHPRLRRALRDEAALLGREMARERERLGEGVGEVVLLN